MINEFGEEISEKKIKEITKRILKLPDKLIDELWYRCGLIYEKPKAILYKDKNKDFKAIFDKQLEDLRKEKEISETVLTFLAETPLKDILDNLDKIENETSKK